MNIFHKPIDEITFEDVEEICVNKTIESTVLDYKREIPSKGLAGHIAAFSNTYGGLIIIGVKENDKTGLPVKWEGVEYNAKIVDSIHTFAAQVTPFPRYDVKITNEKDGKVFIILYIFQGDRPPYMSNTEYAIKIRTGNVTTPLKDVNTVELDKLYSRRDNAAIAGGKIRTFAKEIEELALRSEVTEWKKELAAGRHTNARTPGDEMAAILRIDIMPHTADSPIIDYRKLAETNEYEVGALSAITFPMNQTIKTAPGVIYLSRRSWSDSTYAFHIISDKGFLRSSEDIINQSGADREVFTSKILRDLVRQVMAARKFYKFANFNGLLSCNITLSLPKNTIPIPTLEGGSNSYFGDGDPVMRTDLSWSLMDIDTTNIQNDKLIAEKIVALANEIHWSMGLRVDATDGTNEILKKAGWKF